MAESLHKNMDFSTGVDSLPYLWTAACKGNAVLYCSWMLAGASSVNPVVHRNELQACFDMQAAP